jgi:hypothetical protein
MGSRDLIAFTQQLEYCDASLSRPVVIVLSVLADHPDEAVEGRFEVVGAYFVYRSEV